MVYQVASVVGDAVPIIGLGGIVSVEDVVEFMMAGATAVAVGAATFARPTAANELLDGLTAWMGAQGVRQLGEIRGSALPKPE